MQTSDLFEHLAIVQRGRLVVDVAVLRFKIRLAVNLHEPLDCKRPLIVGVGNDDVAVVGRGLFADNEGIAVEDASVSHGVTEGPDTNQALSGRGDVVWTQHADFPDVAELGHAGGDLINDGNAEAFPDTVPNQPHAQWRAAPLDVALLFHLLKILGHRVRRTGAELGADLLGRRRPAALSNTRDDVAHISLLLANKVVFVANRKVHGLNIWPMTCLSISSLFTVEILA